MKEYFVVVTESDGVSDNEPLIWETHLSDATLEKAIERGKALPKYRYGKSRIAKLTLLDEE